MIDFLIIFDRPHLRPEQLYSGALTVFRWLPNDKFRQRVARNLLVVPLPILGCYSCTALNALTHEAPLVFRHAPPDEEAAYVIRQLSLKFFPMLCPL